jgi:phosphoserine phosphatase
MSLPQSAPPPAEAVRAALRSKAPDAPVVVDFDETLWLRNSTEEYLRSLRPRFLAYLILLALDLLRPWRLIGGRERQHVYRDWVRVLACTVLLPWSLALWRRQAPRLAERWTNRELVAALAEAGERRILVATLGTDAIVRPLLDRIDPGAQLYAAGTLWSGHRIRSLGKEAWIRERHGAEAMRDAVVITDSETDADLLAACAHPVLVRWPDAEYRPALSDAYIPFLYTQRGKRPGERYMLYGVLLEDVALLGLAFAWLMPSPLAGLAGLLCLHLAFWTIYELGYVENDTEATRHEAAPQIWSEAATYAARVRPGPAWLACAAFTGLGTFLLVAFNAPSLTIAAITLDPFGLWLLGFALWMTYVAASRGAYWLYNRLDVGSRSYFYAVLQIFRTLGYALLLELNLIGAVILLSLVLARWVKYLVYRDVGRKMAEDQRMLALLFFAILAIAGLAVEGVAFLQWQALAAAVWLALYSRRRLRQVAERVSVFRLRGVSPEPR